MADETVVGEYKSSSIQLGHMKALLKENGAASPTGEELIDRYAIDHAKDGPEEVKRLRWTYSQKTLSNQSEEPQVGVFLVGQNHKNPGYFARKVKVVAAEYERQTGNKAYIFEVKTKQDVQNALATPNIGRLDYWGHGGNKQMFLSGDEKNGTLTTSDVPSLNAANVRKGANINLLSCRGGHGEDSIAQAFADHFSSNVSGFDGGTGFGFRIPFTDTAIAPWFPRGKVEVRAPGQTAPVKEGSTVPW